MDFSFYDHRPDNEETESEPLIALACEVSSCVWDLNDSSPSACHQRRFCVLAQEGKAAKICKDYSRSERRMTKMHCILSDKKYRESESAPSFLSKIAWSFLFFQSCCKHSRRNGHGHGLLLSCSEVGS